MLEKQILFPLLFILQFIQSMQSTIILFLFVIFLQKIKKNQSQVKMIELEAHSKHVKLLSDYISALEKQLSANKNQLQYIRKVYNFTAIQQSNRIIDDYRIYRTENIKQRQQISQLKQELKRLNFIQYENSVLQKELQIEREERMKINNNIQYLQDINRQLYQLIFKQDLQGNLERQQFDHDRFKLLQSDFPLKFGLNPLQNRNKVQALAIQTKKHQENEKAVQYYSPNHLQLIKEQKQIQEIKAQKLKPIQQPQRKLSEISQLQENQKKTLDQRNSKKLQNAETNLQIKHQYHQTLNSNISQPVTFIFNELNQRLTEYMQKIIYFEEQNNKLLIENNRLKEIQDKYIKEKERILNLQQKNNNLMKDLEERYTEINMIKDQKNMIDQKIKQIMLKTQKQLREYQIKIEKSKRKIEQNELQLQKQKVNALNLSQKCSFLQMSLQLLQKQKKSLQIQIRKVIQNSQKSKLINQQQKKRILESQNIKFSSILKQKKDQIQNLKIKVHQTTEQKVKKVKQLQIQIAKLAEANEQIKRNLMNKNKNQMKVNDSQYLSLIQQKTILMEEIQRKSKELNILQNKNVKKVLELNEKLDYLEKQNFILQEKFNKINVNYILQGQKNQQYLKQMKDLRENIKDLYKIIEGYKLQVYQLSQNVIHKEKAINNLESSNSVLRKQIITHLIQQQKATKKNMQSNNKQISIFHNSNASETNKYYQGKSSIDNLKKLKKSEIFSEKTNDFNDNSKYSSFSHTQIDNNEGECNKFGCQIHGNSLVFSRQRITRQPVQYQISF